MSCATTPQVELTDVAPQKANANTDKNDTKPNIIYINVDDLGWADTGFNGSEYYQTPNLDKLASEGVLFTNSYAAAANCAPSRACAITGQYGPRHGVYTVASSKRGKSSDRRLIPTKNTLHIKEDNVTLGHALGAAGYKTCTIGKWHVSNDPTKNGFDINIAGSRDGGPYRGGYHSPYKYKDCEQDKKGEYLTDRLTDEAIKFVAENQENPFFLYLPFYAVHTPIQGRKDLIEKYKQLKGTKGQSNPNYAAMVEVVDENVGRLLAALDEMNLTENTMVIFHSDNGGVWKLTKQWPLRAGKGSYYEGGIREPMVIKWPNKFKGGTKCDTPVCNIDFFPTFLEAAGLSAPDGKILDGVSLMPLLRGDELKERPLFWHFPIYLQGGNIETRDPKFRTRPGSVVRLGDWKLHEYFEDNGLELYNLKDDIGEKNNLAEANPEKANELHTLLKNWRKETNAPVPSELNPDFGKPKKKKKKK